MTADSVEKHRFIVSNLKLQVTIRFKMFYWLLELLHTPLALSTILTWLFILKIFEYPSDNRISCKAELNF